MNRIPAQMIVTLIWMALIPGHTAQAQIDYASFIESRKLNEKTILLTFGYDAVTAISSQQGIVVIDAGISNQLTAKFRETIEKEFSGNDFACLINTHSHHDHTGGNQVFSDMQIIAHENCPREMEQSQGDPEKVRQNLLKIVEEYETELDTLDYGSEEWKRVYYQKMRYQL
ncbi:MAG: MBL fold metallo-hydrolase, partial [Bacteroidetes bacterium]|nr:MBL fold metallo-hydrolase [Bacteroidota bacterium]